MMVCECRCGELNSRQHDYESCALPLSYTGIRKKGNVPEQAHFPSKWLQGRDLNPRPPGYEPDELPDCSTLRQDVGRKWWARRDLNPHTHLRAMDFKSIVSAIPPLARGKEALNSNEFSEPYCNRSPPLCQGFFPNLLGIFGSPVGGISESRLPSLAAPINYQAP